jgi:T5SS/PEP-CTERM-associated repeat protein/autotransporter-associated beta strand protein
VVGLQGTGTLTVSNDGTVSSPSVYLAYENYPSLNVASQGTVNLDSGGALQTGQIINYEGGIGTGAEFNFDGGILRATANSSDFISGFSPGQVTLQGDGGTIDDNGYNVTISAPISGSGGLTAIGAGTTTLTGNNTYSGNTTIDSGTLAVSGTAAAINSPSSLVYVGNASGDNGTFVISNGARVTDAYGELGSSANSIGTATVTGMNGSASSTWTNSAYIDVGVYGTGTLNIEDGAQVSAYGTYVSDESSGQGTVTVTGVGANGTPSTLNNSEFTFVGEGGPGTLAIENGGYVVDQNAEIGWAGQGTVTVTGVNGGIASTWNNTGNLYVGFYNQGTLNVADGGVVEVDGGSGTITLAYEPNGTGTLNIGNGGLAGTIEAAQVTGMAGASEVEFDETDKSYTFAPTLTGNLKVVQAGTGTTVLTGTNTYTGGTNVRTGSLVAASSGALGSGPVTVSGGMLSSTSGIGAIVGGELSLSSGSIALTSSPIPTFQLALNQNFDMTGGTLSLTFSLGTVGSISSLGGDFTLNGGTLNLNDSFTSPADYALTYVVLSGFGSGSVSGLSIIGYDTVDYAAHFSDGGDLTFTPEDAPEPPSWALLLLGGSSCFAAASRRRRNIRIPAL